MASWTLYFINNTKKTSNTPEGRRFIAIEDEIKVLKNKASELEKKIELFYKDFAIE